MVFNLEKEYVYEHFHSGNRCHECYPQEVLHKSVEVKQMSAKPPHLESSTSFRKTTYASDVPSMFVLYR